MARRDKKSLSSRSQESKETYSKIYIYANGKTEMLYFDSIRRAFDRERKIIFVQSSPANRDSLVDEAYKEFRKLTPNQGDAFFIVFDADILPKGSQPANPKTIKHKVDIALEKCRAKGYRAILSNESFELWILLHFEIVATEKHRDYLYKRVKHYISDYDKTMPDLFVRVRDKLPVARSRARKIVENSRCDGQTPSQANPYTNVYEIIDCIEEKLKISLTLPNNTPKST